MKRRFDYLLTLLLCLGFLSTAQAQSTGSGQIAITGNDGNIYLYDVAGDSLSAVTSDARLSLPEKIYNWPTWSSDGQLAYFGADGDPANPYRLGVFIQAPGGQPKGVYAAQDELFTYAYWSLGDCSDPSPCRDLALLYTNEAGLGVRLIRTSAGFPVTELGQGGPFYWDWSPDGGRMIWARFGAQFDLYDVASAQETTLPYPHGLAQSAADWSPLDERLLLAVGDGLTTRLVLVDGPQETVIAEGLPNGVAFDWSSDALQVAYVDWSIGALYRHELASAQSQLIAPDGVIAFFWSPDGSKLAYLTLEAESDPNPGANGSRQLVGLRWNLYEAATGQNRVLNAFLPTENMLYYLNFFDQFMRSHRLWSPDSRYLVYGERTAQGDQVTLLDTQASKITPRPIAEGNMGVFSW
jgi:TolB protein